MNPCTHDPKNQMTPWRQKTLNSISKVHMYGLRGATKLNETMGGHGARETIGWETMDGRPWMGDHEWETMDGFIWVHMKPMNP